MSSELNKRIKMELDVVSLGRQEKIMHAGCVCVFKLTSL